MSIFRSLIRKEVLHLLRDPRTVTVVLVMPVVLLLLFGFAISTEVNGVRLLAVVGQHTDETHRLLERFRSNPYFTLEGIVAPHEADDLLRQGKADAVLVLRTDGGQLTHQVITDASNTNLAQTAFGTVMGAGLGAKFVAICLFFFAFSTVLGWNLFGKINVIYLFGKKSPKLCTTIYTVVALIFIFLGTTMSNDLVWELSDMFNNLMVIPNVIALFALTNLVVKHADDPNRIPGKK